MPIGVYPRNEMHREICRKANLGRTPWNKGTKGVMKPNSTTFKKGNSAHNTKHTEESKKKISEALKRVFSDGRLKSRHKHSLETRQKISASVRSLGLMIGSRCPNWKGGVTKEHQKIRSSFEMNEWRRKVFNRDNYTCRYCGKHGTIIEAHHIKSFSEYPELRLDINNGITLCIPCHCKVDKYRARRQK